MIKIVSRFSLWGYVRIARPVLFKFSADSVHAFITRAGIIAQSLPLLPILLRIKLRYDHPSLEQELHGVAFKNPIGLSAGFDKEARLPKLMHSIGFGLEEVGSITAKRYDGNKQPWYSRLPHTKSILVNSGLRSSGVEAIAERADRMKPSLYRNFPINASIAKTNSRVDASTVKSGIEDYCTTLRRLEQSPWPSLYTLNISCPNTAGGEPFNKPQNLKKLLKAIDEIKPKRPVFLKLPVDLDWPEIKPLLDVAAKSNIQGITIANLAKDRSLVDPRDELGDDQPGNLSGRPCWEDSNLLLARSHDLYADRFTFIGVGGVFSAQDAYTKIRLGASLVELITGMIYQGPALIGQINAGLAKLLADDGFNNVDQAVGLDVKQYLEEHQ